MNYQTVHGTQVEKPLECECCGDVVFVRRNIKRVTVTYDEESVEMWEYEEAKVSVQEFTEYFTQNTVDTQETQQAQIDYIAMMSDIDLEV